MRADSIGGASGARSPHEMSRGYPGATWVVLVCLVLAVGVLSHGCGGDTDRPNIILITLDTTRADRFGAYGYPRNTTPHMDRIASDGVRFERAQAQSATTPVSCASLLSGRYPYRHGLRTLHGHRKNKLGDDVPLLQESLRAGGYATAAFVSAFPASSRYGFARGYDHFDEAFLESRRATINPDGVVTTGGSQRTAAETNARLLPWLREHDGAPFFVWLHYFDPHDAYLKPPPEFVSEWVRTKPTDGEAYLSELYDAELAFVDQHIGELADTLQSLGLWENTVIVITADHGEGLGDHGWWGHGILYQEQLHVPLIVRGPGIDRGTVVDHLVQHVDIAPTLLDIAGQGALQGAPDGRSLLPLLRGEAAAAHDRSAYAEVHNVFAFSEDKWSTDRGEMYSVTNGEMKLIHVPRNPKQDELFNLVHDPDERRNLIAAKPEAAASLLADLQARNAIDHYVPDPNTLPAEMRARLEELGYLEPDE